MWDPIPGKIVTKLRYSVWCDQFQIEQVELAPVVDTAVVDEAVLAFGIHLAQPGAAYVMVPRGKQVGASQGGDQSVRLTFTKLTPSTNGYDVEAQIARFDQKDLTKVLSTEKYTGTVRGSSTAKYALLFTLSPPSGRDNLVLELVVDTDGSTAGALIWNIHSVPKGLPMPGQLVSAKIVAEDEKQGKVRRQIGKARQLATDGNRDEAEKLLKEILAMSSNDKQTEDFAKRSLKGLDFMVEEGARKGKRPRLPR